MVKNEKLVPAEHTPNLLTSSSFQLQSSKGLISFFIGLLYYNAINGHTRSAVMYSLFCYAILTQWFQDQFASLATTWIIFFLLVSASLIRLKR